MNILGNLSPEKYQLGALCKHGHDWQGTGQSIRNIKTKACYECGRKSTINFRQKNRTHCNQQASKYREINPENTRKIRRESATRSRRKNGISKAFRVQNIPISVESFGLDSSAFRFGRLCVNNHNFQNTGYSLRHIKGTCVECNKEQSKLFRDSFPERNRIIKKQCRDKNVIKYRITENRNRVRRRNAPSIPYSDEAINKRFQEFGNCCAYCGKPRALQIEHIVALSQGGYDSIENIVPACIVCNSSKKDHDVESWYRKQTFFDEFRWQQLTYFLTKKHG